MDERGHGYKLELDATQSGSESIIEALRKYEKDYTGPFTY